MNSSLSAQPWGSLPDGRAAHRWTLRNAMGMAVTISDLGGTLLSWDVPDRQGRFGDVLLGHATPDDYLKATAFMGALVGRWANRIRDGRFELDGVIHKLDRNDGPNHLHGGFDGFHRKLWDVGTSEGALIVSLTSPEGDSGFPGEVHVRVTYALADDGTLSIDYEARTDAPTPLSLTSHPYFNLNDRRGDIRDHMIRIDADAFLAIDATGIPVDLRSVAGSAFDFRTAAPVGARLLWPDEQLRVSGGFDHCYVLNAPGKGLREVALVTDPASGRQLAVSTDQAGLQFYTGQKLAGSARREGGQYEAFAGFALEAQAFPNQVNSPRSGEVILKPGQTYRQSTSYRISIG
ncbi:aldose 1-epimerase [Luteibacter sp. Sphag1AF]|uniref:aldose epimerase family protein n=1 Tax=Luteibacter sp. Sphag1AF TaxID=2587031 RepID=UPI00160735C6|nr:aldose epimerase family protein [Luteibacter sp. Sphag1AF]MBB3226053.1 aldose 1-epimerase [Luteibacter sp. Sphag1AF]